MGTWREVCPSAGEADAVIGFSHDLSPPRHIAIIACDWARAARKASGKEGGELTAAKNDLYHHAERGRV